MTGGRADKPVTPAAGGDPVDLWEKILEAQRTKHVVGVRCPAGSASADEAQEKGLVPGRSYCLVTAGDTIGGKLLKLRGFTSDPEWTGKWADKDKAWTNQLRQLLSYQDASDGSFWMASDDFNRYFAEVDLVRMADDRWTRLTVRSRWMDQTAGGGPAHLSWRNNYQWLLGVSKPTKVVFQLTLPAGERGKLPPVAAGLAIVRGNEGEDAKRRKPLLRESSDFVLRLDPTYSRRVSVEATLQPSETPYAVVPFLSAPGAESAFSLVLLSDDRDDDGKLDFGFEPVRPAPQGDWYTQQLRGAWAQAAHVPGELEFGENTQLRFGLSGPASARAHVYVFVETLGVQMDMRLEAGVQSAPRYPAVGLLLLPSLADGAAVTELAAGAIHAQPQAREGVWLEATLEADGSTHVVVPYLAAGEDAEGLTFVVTVYSDLPQEATKAAVAAAEHESFEFCYCEKCNGNKSPYQVIIEKMECIEAVMDERLAFLDGLLAGA